MPKAFLTGSHAYGTPKDSSDIDLVLVATKQAMRVLAAGAEKVHGSAEVQSLSLRFGRLNLMCVSEAEYELWRSGTKELKTRKPVDRETAKQFFIKLLGKPTEGR